MIEQSMAGAERHRGRCRAVTYLFPLFAAAAAVAVMWSLGPIPPTAASKIWGILIGHGILGAAIPAWCAAVRRPAADGRALDAASAMVLAALLYVIYAVAIMWSLDAFGIPY